MAEIGEDEGILGNNFTMAKIIIVWPHEGAVYLPKEEVALSEELGE